MFIYEGKKSVNGVEVECLNIMFQKSQMPTSGTPDVSIYKDNTDKVHIQVEGTDINT
jgi:hypothetical protein